MSKHENEFGAFLLGFFVGGLIGAAVGLLFAPQSGGDTREQIRQKSTTLSEQASHKADEARAKAEKLLADARLKFDEASAQLQERAKELQAQTKSLIEEKKTQLKKKSAEEAPTTPQEPGAEA